MENQIHHSVTTEHELMVDGKTFKEVREMVKISEESKPEKSTLVHMRSIEDRYYTVHQTMNNGQVEDEKIETNLEEENGINLFKEEWEAVWNPPTIGQKVNGIVNRFKNILKF